MIDLYTKYGAFVSISSLNITANTGTEYRLRDAVASFLLRKKKKSTEKSGTRRWNIQVACKGKYANTCQVLSRRQIAPGGGYVGGWPGCARTTVEGRQTRRCAEMDTLQPLLVDSDSTNNFSARTPRYKIILPIYYRRYSYLSSNLVSPSCKATP